ncbi:MAG: putative metal-binding motif-containing protein [Sandaracinaceae bacterium]
MRWLILTSTLLVFACDGEAPAPDAGPRDAQVVMDSGPAEPCTADRECDDDLFCTVHRCLPGNPAGDARGCVMVDDPCAPGEVCDEAMDRCATETCGPDPDADGDGVDSIACGGIDCDDDDEFRFPGNAEVCDAMGHDEDCTDETVAGATDGDLDEDGFTSALCCNGANCGDDCDDDDRSVFPGARELCNGRDDDCDGMTDEEPPGADPLCPGGTCSAGRCDLRLWERTFGGAGGDLTSAVTMDRLGRVYVAGWFQGTATFGGPPLVSASPDNPDAFVVAFGADGSYRWARRYGGVAADVATDISYDPIADQIYVAVASYGDADYGMGVRPGPTSAILALGSDGSYLWDRTLPDYPFVALDGHDGVVFNTLLHSGRAHDFGGGVRTPRGEDLIVVRLRSDGSYLWDVHVRAPTGGQVRPARISLSADGSVSVAGDFRGGAVDFGDGPRTNQGANDIFALRLSASGSHVWDYTAGGAGVDSASALRLARDGGAFLVGSFEGTVDFGLGPELAPAPTSAFLLSLGPAGSALGARSWGGSGRLNAASSVAQDSSGNVHVVGSFAGAVNFGGGNRMAPADGAGFHAVFDSALNHRSDRMYSFAGADTGAPCPDATCEVRVVDLVVGAADSTALAGYFEANVDLGGGTRFATGGADGFIVRLGR